MLKNIQAPEIGKDIHDWIRIRHYDWWNFLINEIPTPENFDERLPDCIFMYHKSRYAGRANCTYCKYSIPWALSEQENYDKTIAHEICHTFAKRITGYSAKHGPFWNYLINVVCGFKNMSECNSYKWPTQSIFNKAKKLRQILKLKEQINALSK
jgi:hypothetical protein